MIRPLLMNALGWFVLFGQRAMHNTFGSTWKLGPPWMMGAQWSMNYVLAIGSCRSHSDAAVIIATYNLLNFLDFWLLHYYGNTSKVEPVLRLVRLMRSSWHSDVVYPIDHAASDVPRPLLGLISFQTIRGIPSRRMQAYDQLSQTAAENMSFCGMLWIYPIALALPDAPLQRMLFPTDTSIYYVLITACNSVAIRIVQEKLCVKLWGFDPKQCVVFSSPFSASSLSVWFSSLAASFFAMSLPLSFGWWCREALIGPWSLG